MWHKIRCSPCSKLCSPLLATTNFLRPVEIGATPGTTLRMVRVAVVMHSLRLWRIVGTFYGIHNVVNHTPSESDPEIMRATLKARVPQLITVISSYAMEKKVIFLRTRLSSHQLRVCNSSSSSSSILRPYGLFRLQKTSFHQTT